MAEAKLLVTARGVRGFHALLHLFHRDVFFVRRDGPYVPERIGECACAVAIKLIFHALLLFCAGGNCSIENGVDILDVNHETDRCSSP